MPDNHKTATAESKYSGDSQTDHEPSKDGSAEILDSYSYTRRSDAIPLGRLREAYIHLTNRCQGGCKHCYASSSVLLKEEELSTEEWRRVVDRLSNLGTQNLVFLGGDPFERDDLLDLVSYATGGHDLNVRIFYGRYVDPPLAARLLESGHDRLTLVASLEGPTAESNDYIRGRGSFARIVEGIRNLMAVGLVPVVNTVVTSANLPLLPQLASFLDSLGVERLHLLLPHNRGYICRRPELIPRSDDLAVHLLNLRESVRDLRLWVDNFAAWESRLGGGYDLCNAGYSLLTIAHDGGIYACPATVGDSRFICGNIKLKDLKDIWEQSEAMREIRDASLAHREACRACEIATVCGGECIVQAYYHEEATAGAGSLSAAYPYCEAVGAMLKSMLSETVPSPVKGVHYIECT